MLAGAQRTSSKMLTGLLIAFVLAGIASCGASAFAPHPGAAMSQNGGVCQNIQQGLVELSRTQNTLRSAVLAFGGLFLVWLLVRRRFDLLPAKVNGSLTGVLRRIQTSVFFDSGFRQLRLFQIFARALPDPQIFSA